MQVCSHKTLMECNRCTLYHHVLAQCAHAVTRGYKVVVKFFPNEAANLEPVVDLLLKLEEQVHNS